LALVVLSVVEQRLDAVRAVLAGADVTEVDAFRAEYNTDRPHQALGMAFPAEVFIPRPADERLPLRLPTALTVAAPAPRPAPPTGGSPEPTLPAPPVVSPNGGEPVHLAVERGSRPCRRGSPPASCGSCSPTAAAPAGPSPLPAGDSEGGIAVEVDRLVSATGLIGLAGRRHQVGSQFAGRRLTVRLDRGLLQLVDQGVLLRSLPNPLTPAEQARLRDARPAGPPPTPSAEPLRVQRRVSCRGALVFAKQRIHVGIVHAGRTLTVETGDATWRIYDEDHLVAEVARTTTKSVARFKIHKPEPPRRPQTHLDTRGPSGSTPT
jgi:hypothetical protein